MDEFIAGIDIVDIVNLEKIKYIFNTNPLMIKLKFDREEATKALRIYTEQIKYIKMEDKKELCMFTNEKVCCSCIPCKFRVWDFENSLPLCKHSNTIEYQLLTEQDSKQI
jgi:hypothetical protein